MNIIQAVEYAKKNRARIKMKSWPDHFAWVEIKPGFDDQLLVKHTNRTELAPFTPHADDVLGEWEIAPKIIRLQEADRGTIEINQTAHGGQSILINGPAEITVRYLQ